MEWTALWEADFDEALTDTVRTVVAEEFPDFELGTEVRDDGKSPERGWVGGWGEGSNGCVVMDVLRWLCCDCCVAMTCNVTPKDGVVAAAGGSSVPAMDTPTALGSRKTADAGVWFATCKRTTGTAKGRHCRYVSAAKWKEGVGG